MQLNKIDVSVIICCYNSENRIVSTLEHLSMQTLGTLSCEIILVDNNCTDSTASTAEKYWVSAGSPYEFRIVKESQPGLSFARKSGVREAKGEIIVFCDDDNWLDKEYIKTAFEIMQNDASIGVLAGQSRAVSDIEIPTWFYTYYGWYACGVLAMESGDVTTRKWVWGAGMVLRRDVMLKMYMTFSHLTTDRKGMDLTSGGDVEICLWHIISDFKLWYSAELLLGHYMQNSRLNPEVAVKQFAAQNKSAFALKKLDMLASEYLIWSISKSAYILSILRQLAKFQLIIVFSKVNCYLVFSGFIRNKLMDSAKIIKNGNTKGHAIVSRLKFNRI